jgi:4-hydroxy-tetrahydrodipicolinate reductase
VKIVISGYGKMGREIETAALARGHEIAAKIDLPEDWDMQSALIKACDIVIDFSTPASVVSNIRHCFDFRRPLVVGTTGWNDSTGLVKKWCLDEKQALFTASNFSIGVNILYSLTGHLSKIINKIEDYDISLEEIHHIHKLDSPSGTAIRLAEIILEEIERKQQWVNHVTNLPEELQVTSVREGEIPGIHSVTCESATDKLILRHEAKGRKGFAIGALLAAEWLHGKTGFYGMKDMLQLPVQIR